ncbi:MAG: PTS mannitol transporter subunit IICBA [Fusobacteriaceae bacterium]|nr:PTS mannitol transporter subunit IICBA [Fusobacteriaceae bacterium]
MSENTVKQRIQSYGRALSSMVMPNIGAFIAWGLITALFISSGWLPNEKFATLVGPMLTYMLPVLIGYTGGKNVHGVRGGVIGAIATIGVIVGANIPMFLGAMILGPFAGWVLKKVDESIEGKIPAGFEMLVNNFALGILGALFAMFAMQIMGPVVVGLTNFLTAGVHIIVGKGLFPLVSLFIEPAKILFLNNAINHGILGPMGLSEARELGKSVFFLLETNPGPGLGVLLAYWMFAKGSIKESAPGSILIHFLGGIHEIYFPYVLMNPVLVLAVIGGGISGVFTFNVLKAGLVAAPSPGSIIALMAMTPRGGHFAVLAGVVVSTVVSFLIASVFVKRAAAHMSEDALTTARQEVKDRKLESKGLAVKPEKVELIVYACDAGMGSSAMGASMLGKRLKAKNITIPVKNYAINEIPANASIVVSHEQLTPRAKEIRPGACHISVTDFLDMSVADKILGLIGATAAEAAGAPGEKTAGKASGTILKKENILTGQRAATKEEAVRLAGNVLVKGGYVRPEYVDSMLKRESEVSTYLGKGLAIPHCAGDGKSAIIKSGFSVLLFPEGVDFAAGKAYIVCGIAGKNDEHIDLIASLANLVDAYEEKEIKKLAASKDVDAVYSLFEQK